MTAVVAQGSNELEATCTDRLGTLDEEHFNQRAGALCYAFLFPEGKPLHAQPFYFLTLAPSHANDSLYTEPIAPNIRNR